MVLTASIRTGDLRLTKPLLCRAELCQQGAAALLTSKLPSRCAPRTGFEPAFPPWVGA